MPLIKTRMLRAATDIRNRQVKDCLFLLTEKSLKDAAPVTDIAAQQHLQSALQQLAQEPADEQDAAISAAETAQATLRSL